MFLNVAILVLIVVFIIDYFIACEFRQIASDKGYSDCAGKYFWYVFLTGIPGMLLVIALPDKNDKIIINSVKNEIDDELPEL